MEGSFTLHCMGLMILMFMLQLCKYKLLGDDLNSLRYAWYGYHISIILSPFLMYQIAVLVGTNEEGRCWVNKKGITIIICL